MKKLNVYLWKKKFAWEFNFCGFQTEIAEKTTFFLNQKRSENLKHFINTKKRNS